MNVFQTIEDIQFEKCFLCRPIPNKFYNYLHFYKLSYNLLSFTLNSMLIWINLKQYSIKENDQIVISYTMEEEFVEKLMQFEKNLLERCNQTLQKKIHLPTYEHKNLFFCKHKTEDFKLYFRISGIWESETHIGLTTKVDLYPST